MTCLIGSPPVPGVALVTGMNQLERYWQEQLIPLQGEMEKIRSRPARRAVHDWRVAVKKSKALIEIDGGVDLKNAQVLVKEGADVLVAGNTVFGSKNPSETISHLKKSK